MKPLFTFLFLIMVGFSVLAGDSICHPTLREIYNFNIGDIYQYHIDKGYIEDGSHISSWTKKYSILDKSVENDTIKYIRHGISQYRELFIWNYVVKYKWGPSTTEFQDTLIIIDSINHFLNSCQSDTVLLKDEVFKNDTIPYISIVSVYSDNGIIYKHFEDTTLYHNYMTYKENIGITDQNQGVFNQAYNLSMQGYIKDGDTTGYITSDEELYASTVDTICGPSLKEIYNFNIGDVFQYKIFSEYMCDGWNVSEGTKKCTIVDKSVENDTIKYIRHGISRLHNYLANNNEILYDHGVSTTEFQDTLIIIDSMYHILNGCQGDTGILNEETFGYHIGPYNSVVRVDNENGDVTKSFEGIDYSFRVTYEEKLGIIYQAYGYFEQGYNLILEGYIKDGDITGIITSDENLITSIEVPAIEDKIRIYPTVIHNDETITILNKPTNSIIQIISLDGRIAEFEKINDNILSLSKLPNGTYFIRISSRNNVFCERILKY
jgi:hypothetical protein